MALSKNYHRYGETEPMGLKIVQTLFADEYAKRTAGLPSRKHVPESAGAHRAVQAILPKLEVKMIEFLAEWMVTLLMPGRHVMEVRHLIFPS